MEDLKDTGNRKVKSNNRRGGGRGQSDKSTGKVASDCVNIKRGPQEIHSLDALAMEFKPGSRLPADEIPFSMVSCLICAADSVQFVSVGACDHPVCSLCSMRLRYKSRDCRCPICTQDMEYVVVHSTCMREKRFSSFGIWGDSAAPGINVDHQTGMLYFECESHFIEMTNMRSLVCPTPACRMRFASEDQLLRHLGEVHSLALCRLCLAHRPLFLAEQKLLTPAQLSQHLNAPPGAVSGKKGDKMGGHPPCRFCKDHFFDTHELYKHMRSAHSTCHLCPSSLQDRFFKNGKSLRDHIRDNHIMCSFCDTEAAFEADQEIGFRSVTELNLHMQQVHRIVGADRERGLAAQLGFGFHSSRKGGRGDHSSQSTALDYVDMDFSAADPNRQGYDGHLGEAGICPEVRGGSVRRGGQRGGTGGARAIGGGGGGGSSEARELFKAGGSTGPNASAAGRQVPQWVGSQLAVHNEDKDPFPTLEAPVRPSASSEDSVRVTAKPSNTDVQAALHPLSLMRQKLATGKVGAGTGAEAEGMPPEESPRAAELRRGLRHLALAEALGVDSV